MPWYGIVISSILIGCSNASVAQLDRASGYEPGGWGFESLREYNGAVASKMEKPLNYIEGGSYGFESRPLHNIAS